MPATRMQLRTQILGREKQTELDIQNLVNVLQDLCYHYGSASVKEIVYTQVSECLLDSMADEARIDRDIADAAAQLVRKMDLNMKTVENCRARFCKL